MGKISSREKPERRQIDYIYKYQSSTRFHLSDDKTFSWLQSEFLNRHNRKFILVDKNFSEIWGSKIFPLLCSSDSVVLEVEASEECKSLSYLPIVIEELQKHKCGRFDLVIGLGGGCVLDLASFLASVYMRGLPFVAVPTTLIGQTDAATAGKTCLNTAQAKNLLGTFYFPSDVYNNVNFLETCSERINRQGYSEIFKYGLLGSRKLLDLLDKLDDNSDSSLLLSIIEETIRVRLQIRDVDPLASNLGHTFGHALERLSTYKILHGDAITAGTVLALNFAAQKGVIAPETVTSIVDSMKRNGLNLYIDSAFGAEELVSHMLRDKKSAHNQLNLVLIEDIEKPYSKNGFPFFSCPPNEVIEFLDNFLESYAYRIENASQTINSGKLSYS